MTFSTLRPCPIASVGRSARRLPDPPSQALVDDLARVDGDLLILGVAGKMGPTLARLAKRATPARRVIGVARFSDAGGARRARRARRRDDRLRPARPRRHRSPARRAERRLRGRPQVRRQRQPRPDLGDEHPRARARRRALRASRIVAFSTGNVYRLDAGRPAPARANRRRRRRSASTRSRASAASACSSTSRSATARRAGSCGSTTRSTCATACSSTSPRRSSAASRST